MLLSKWHMVILEPCFPIAFGFKPLRQKDLQGRPLWLLPTYRGTSRIITTESLQVILAKGTYIVPKHGRNNKLIANICFTIQCLKKRNEKQVLQANDPFLPQQPPFTDYIHCFFVTWDKSSPAYTHQPQLWANEAPMTCVWRWKRTVGSGHWSHVRQMLL